MSVDPAFELTRAVFGRSRFAFVKAPGATSSVAIVGDPIEVRPVNMANPPKLVQHLQDEVMERVGKIPAVERFIQERDRRLEEAEGRILVLEGQVANLKRYKLMWYGEMCRSAGMSPSQAEAVIAEAMAKEVSDEKV
jgi:hypothetical protein